MGAIDCTHIKIPCPGGENAELFRNRKGYFSINVQAVCGPNLYIFKHCRTYVGQVAYMMPEYPTIVAYVHSGDIQGICFLVITVVHAANI